jgi:glucokinase
MLSIGVDIGGSTVRAALVENGQVVRTTRIALEQREVDAVAAVTAQQLSAIQAPPNAALGVAIAGMVRDNVVANAPNLGWRNADFAGALQRLVGRPVRLVNDLSAAAWGERCAGAAQGARNSVTVFVGTGVGSALIVDDRLVSGATGVAGEFGHIKLVADGGRPCGCGQQGCLEAYAGGANLIRWMGDEGLSGTPADLEREALAGHAGARQLHTFVGEALGLAIANVVTLLNPQVVVLGGGVLLRCPALVQHIRRVVGNRTASVAAEAVRVEIATLGDDSGLVGAALLAA